MLNGILWEFPGGISLVVAALSCDPPRVVGIDDQSRADELSVVWTLFPVYTGTLSEVGPSCGTRWSKPASGSFSAGQFCGWNVHVGCWFGRCSCRSMASVVMPPSHRRRGATTVFGQNRHHRSDTGHRQ